VELAGRVALVTGGSGDLGSAICRALARDKMDVAVTYAGEQERAERVVAEVEAAGGRSWAIRLDQSTINEPDEVVASTLQHLGRIDVLVNNAAWNIGVPFSDLEARAGGRWGFAELTMAAPIPAETRERIAVSVAACCLAAPSGMNRRLGFFASYRAKAAMAARSNSLSCMPKCGMMVFHSAAGSCR